MWKSVFLSRISLIISFVLLVITQAVVVHAAQELMQDTKWARLPGLISFDLLKHYP